MLSDKCTHYLSIEECFVGCPSPQCCKAEIIFSCFSGTFPLVGVENGSVRFLSRDCKFTSSCVCRYGRLNVGDQILLCDGVNLIDVTHDEAAQALKRAMDMDSVS